MKIQIFSLALLSATLMACTSANQLPDSTNKSSIEIPQPTHVSVENSSSRAMNGNKVKDRELARYLLPMLIEHAYGKTDYLEAWRDLNGDQIKDAVVLLQGKEWCGSGGCTMLIYHAKNDHSLTLVTKTTVTNTPIYQLSSTQNGWSDLSVYSKGVGQVKLSFDGKSYPTNPSLEKPYQIQKSDRAFELIQ